ncbi:hypothetical protein [Nocardia testacea]|uniref:hypothetical protein n=1 Tax=Nocardia testacea TaxID=248551 RepID=UPI0002D75345|nr:hypothetical protein [Nocardia testacea]
MGFDMASLSPREHEFLDSALASYTGVSTSAPIPVRAFGFDDRDLFDTEVGRLRHAVAEGLTLNDLDTARVLFLSELAFGSDLLGAGVEFQLVSPMRDDEAIVILRQLQRKLYTRDGAKALFRPDLYPPR